MDGVLQRVVSVLIAVVILFILPVYIAYEKKDDISYALALKITTDFVDNVNSKGYITSDMYNDFITKLSVTQNSYDVYMEHTAKKYNPVIYSYTDDLSTIRAKFDYNLYKDGYEAGQIVIAEGTSAGTYNNLVLAYDLAEKKYTEEQILDVISSTNRALTTRTDLTKYQKMDFRSLPAITSIYMPENITRPYTMNKGDEFNVIIKNRNTTMASVIYNVVTFGVAGTNNTKIYVNYGGTIKAEGYREKIFEDENAIIEEESNGDTESLINSYITQGLVLLLNGEYNNGTAHSNSANIWKDLSGLGNNAILNGFDFNDESGWIYNGLHFTGKEYVALKDFDTSDMTIEVVAKFDNISDIDTPEQSVLSCINNGGAGLVFNQLNTTDILKRGKFSFDVLTSNVDNPVSSVISKDIVQANKIYSISGSVGKMDLKYDGDMFVSETVAQLLSVNGKVEGIPFNDQYLKPATGSTFIIGGNPFAGAGADTQFKGTIYCIRIYNRALTEEEIQENYKIDKQRYGIE